MPRIIYQRSSGAWWKVLLGVFLGIVLGVALVVGGVAGVAAFVSTGEIITMTGGDPNAILTEEYQNKTVLDIVMDAVGGNIKIETLGDIADITPMIDTYVTNLSEQLDDLGCDLSKDEIYSWPLTELSDNLINSVKKVELIHFLSKDKVDNPDPIVKYICYQTDKEGNYVLDENGKEIKHTLADMLDNGSFLQTKIDTMKIGTLFTEEEINKSSQLKAIKDKTVKELSKDGAFDDIKIADFVGSDNKSKIIQALRRDGVTIGTIGEGVNNLYLDDVFDYKTDEYDQLPAALKKLLAKEAYAPLPGEEVATNPFTIHKMVYDSEGYPKEFDYIVLSDGKFREGVEAGKETVGDLVNKTDYLKISDIFAWEDITVNKQVNGEKVTWKESYSNPYSGTPERNGNTETFDMNIHKPAEWNEIYVYCCNKPAKVNELDSSIDSLALKDVMKIKPTDALWKVRNEPIKDGEGLFNSIKNKLVLSDIITNYQDVKFLNKIDPNTKISEIGEAVNNLPLLDAFSDNIFDKNTHKINTKWKYLLTEEDENWLTVKAMVSFDDAAPVPLTLGKYDSNHKYNYWHIEVPVGAAKAVFMRYSGDGSTYWNAKTEEIDLTAYTPTTNMFDISASAEAWYDGDEKLDLIDDGTWATYGETDMVAGHIYFRDSAWWNDIYESDNPFMRNTPNAYKCCEYTVGGSGNKGIDQLITNMTNNMKRSTMNQLKADSIVDVSDAFLNTPIDTRYNMAATLIAQGKTHYGDLTIKEFTDLISAGFTIAP